MLLQEKTWQNRYDFHGIFVCEYCGSTQEETTCYDDEYYHETVIPTKIRCKVCGLTTAEGKNKEPNFHKVELVLSEETIQLCKELEGHYRFGERLGGRAKLFEEALNLYNFYYHEVQTMGKNLYTGFTFGTAEEIRIADGKVELVREEEELK